MQCDLCGALWSGPHVHECDRQKITALEAELAQARREAERWREIAAKLVERDPCTPPGRDMAALRQALSGRLDPEPDDGGST